MTQPTQPPAKRLQFRDARPKSRVSTIIYLVLLSLLLAYPIFVFADQVQNDVTLNGTDTFAAGGSTVVGYRIQATGGDGQPGCNASDGSAAVVTINTPSAVTASKNPLTFPTCGNYITTTFSSITPGNYSITVTVSDSGDGTYNTNPAAFTLKVLAPADSTAPTASPSQFPAANGNGWNNSDVTVTWNWADNAGGSGINAAQCTTSTTSSGEGELTLNATCKDNAGNEGSASYTVKVDKTAPSVSASASPAPNGSGWNNADVTVSFSGTDIGGSGIDTCAAPITLSYEGSGQSATGSCTDKAGNNASATSATINIDKTAPSVSASAAPAANGNGWNNSDVTVIWTWVDNAGGSEINPAQCTTSSTSSGEGELTLSATCKDNADNAGSASYPVKVDKTAPSVIASASPAANSYGWNNSDVTVSFSGNDGSGSGIDSCDAAVVLGSEGAGQSASGSCSDLAGNSASATASGINIDKTAPSVSASASPAPNANGWNNSNVTVSFSGSDIGGSGIAGCDASVVLGSNGSGQSAGGACTDKAGNSASATASGINIDKIAPSVSVTGIVSGTTYILGSVPAAGCDTSDSLSGVATAATLSTSGGPVVGSFTATCSGAKDKADNGASATATYSVVYNWAGFFQPVENPGSGQTYVFNRVKAGSAVPMKFSLFGNQGLGIFWTGSPKSSIVSCSTAAYMDDVTETVIAGSSSLSYDASKDQYNYVWKTDKAWGGTCRKFTVKLNDGQEYYAYFNFTK